MPVLDRINIQDGAEDFHGLIYEKKARLEAKNKKNGIWHTELLESLILENKYLHLLLPGTFEPIHDYRRLFSTISVEGWKKCGPSWKPRGLLWRQNKPVLGSFSFVDREEYERSEEHITDYLHKADKWREDHGRRTTGNKQSEEVTHIVTVYRTKGQYHNRK